MNIKNEIACDITTLTPEELKHTAKISFELFASVQEVRNLSDGYALRLNEAKDTLSKLFEFITYDRLCCPFVVHTVVVEAKGGHLWLHLTGAEGVKNFITSEFMSFPNDVLAARFKKEISDYAGESGKIM